MSRSTLPAPLAKSSVSGNQAATVIRAVDPENDVTRARLELGLTQEAFAQLLETPVGTVRGWEQGRRQPPPCAKLLMRLAMRHPDIVLECSTAEGKPPLRPNKTTTSKAAPKEGSAKQVAAQLHQAGNEADFWLL